MAVLLAIILFAFGLVSGLLFKGITINIIHKRDVDNKPQEYNQSLAPLLPQQVQEYYKSTNGQNQF
jgi:hypothetical protein